jgi:hypothetical protein
MAYRMGYAATSAMSTIDGDTIQNARRFSERPRVGFLAAGAGIEAASAMA